MGTFLERLFGEEKDKTKYKESKSARRFRQNIHKSAGGIHDFTVSVSPQIDVGTGKVEKLSSTDLSEIDNIMINEAKQSTSFENKFPSKKGGFNFPNKKLKMSGIIPLVFLLFFIIAPLFSVVFNINISGLIVPIIIIFIFMSIFKKR